MFFFFLSVGTLAKYTAGQVYYYPAFQSAIHGEKLSHELRRDLTRETAWEAVMRIRCAKGLCIHFVLETLTFLSSFLLHAMRIIQFSIYKNKHTHIVDDRCL